MADARPGLLLLDKPAGVSSFGAIARLRPAIGRRVGHAGTLDPFATGLMLVLAGRATRLATYLSGADKRYLATVRLGVRSTTDDPEGDLEPGGAPPASRADVEAALPAFRGPITQVPPAASAVHVDGERAYRRFRRGEVVEMPSRDVVVRALELVAFDEPAQEAVLDVRCSTGTYIRAIARDLGDALGTGAYCAALRRTEVGGFDVRDAAAPDVALADPYAVPHWRPPAEALPHLPHLAVDARAAGALAHGRSVPLPAAEPGVACAIGPDGALVAIVRVDAGRAAPTLVLEAA